MTNTRPMTNMVARWSSPIAIRIGEGHSELIHGPDEALFYFRHRWPIKDAPMMNAAVRRCVAAKNFDLPCEIAKQAVVAAAIEAAVLD